jgi:hypothetical protein
MMTEHDQEFASPIEFAKLVEMPPQTIYMWIRQGKLNTETCGCGRKVLHIKRSKQKIEQAAA